MQLSFKKKLHQNAKSGDYGLLILIFGDDELITVSNETNAIFHSKVFNMNVKLVVTFDITY